MPNRSVATLMADREVKLITVNEDGQTGEFSPDEDDWNHIIAALDRAGFELRRK